MLIVIWEVRIIQLGWLSIDHATFIVTPAGFDEIAGRGMLKV